MYFAIHPNLLNSETFRKTFGCVSITCRLRLHILFKVLIGRCHLLIMSGCISARRKWITNIFLSVLFICARVE